MKREIGKLFLDIAKYIVTAIILTRIFGNFENDGMMYFVASVTVVILLLIGLWLTEEKEKKNRNFKRR